MRSKKTATAPAIPKAPLADRMKKGLKLMRRHWQFYLLIALPLIYIIIFCYVPMPGILMAFERYSPSKGLFKSQWVGLQNFKQFFASPSSTRIIWNTLRIGLYSLIAGFPIPIILAIAVNEVSHKRFKKTVQMVTYAPYFISTVVLVGILCQITDPRLGILNKIIEFFGGDAINFMGDPKMFDHLYVWSGIWQGVGYSSVIYIAALAGVSKELQEAAVVDGASRWQRIWHVDLPSIRPQIVILLIFNVGNILNIGYEKIYLMQNDLNIQKSEIISTFVYKVGLVNADYGFSTAVGLFNALISIALIAIANTIAKKTAETSIW